MRKHSERLCLVSSDRGTQCRREAGSPAYHVAPESSFGWDCDAQVPDVFLGVAREGAELGERRYRYAERAIGLDRNRAARSRSERLLAEHSEAANRISNRTTHEDIRQKVSRQGKSRKSNHRSHAVHSVWNPAVISIAAGDDSGNRERRDGVTRGETSVSSQT